MKDEVNDELILFLAVIAQAFVNSNQEPASLSLADFKPLSFSKVNELIDRFAGDKSFIVLSRPKSEHDTTPYKLEQTEHQKAEYAKTKNEMEHLRDVQMLMIYWGRICTIYDAMAGQYGSFENGQLNRLYLLLTIRVDKILAKDEFEEQRKARPNLYDSFMGNLEDLDIAYEFMRPEIWNYYGMLERQFVEKADGVGAFKLTDEEQKLIDDTDKAAREHKKILARWEAANFGTPTVPEDKKGSVTTQERPMPEADAENPSMAEQPKPAAAKVKPHKFEARHYLDRKGMLTVSPTVEVAIAKRGKVKRRNGDKYDQCWLMELLFKNVNSLNNGVTFRKFLGVKYDKNNKKHVKKIRNTIDEINRKVAEKTTTKKLIFTQAEKIFVDKSYL